MLKKEVLQVRISFLINYVCITFFSYPLIGELLIRHSLQHAFGILGVHVIVLRSDYEFNKCDLSSFDIIVVDPWTWAAPGRAKLLELLNIAVFHATY